MSRRPVIKPFVVLQPNVPYGPGIPIPVRRRRKPLPLPPLPPRDYGPPALPAYPAKLRRKRRLTRRKLTVGEKILRAQGLRVKRGNKKYTAAQRKEKARKRSREAYAAKRHALGFTVKHRK